MLTVCPKCTLTLAVTASDLRMGQGYVRCGRCGDVFNALLSLRDESLTDTASTQPQPALRLEPAAVPEAAPVPAPEPAAPEPALESAPEPAPAPAQTQASAAAGELIVEEFEVAYDVAPPVVEAGATTDVGEVEFLTGDTFTADATALARPMVPDAVADVAGTAVAGESPSTRDDEGDARADASATASAVTPIQIPRPPERSARPGRVLQAAGIVLATLLLAAQCIHHWRNSIASRPGWYPLMSRVYSAVGLRLTPDWNLADYDLRQLGAASYAISDQTLWIKLHIANRGPRALPWPALRLNLSDRYGKRLATRLLQPQEYLTRAQPAGGFMLPAQQVQTEVGINSPMAASSSFELDVCLPAAAGMRCANDEVLGPPAHS